MKILLSISFGSLFPKTLNLVCAPTHSNSPKIKLTENSLNSAIVMPLRMTEPTNIKGQIKSGGFMYTYDLLENGCYYLVKEKEDSPITLIKVAVASDHCLFIQKFEDPTDTEWKLKKDPLFDIIECLSDEAVKNWEEQYKSSEDAYYEDDDED